MTTEREIASVFKLEDAWRNGDTKSCYRFLSLISDGLTFRLGNLLFELSQSTTEEKMLMQRSIREKRELGLVKTAEKSTEFAGFEGGIDMDDIAGALYEIVDPEKPATFSHTHWDKNKHPLPGYSGIGFGDIPLFNMFIDQFPLLECRAVFNNKNTARTVIYKGQFR
jgi:hypothetical protein